MSDTIHSARGKSAGRRMTSAVAHGRKMLIDLVVANHRGPADTWTAARDRTAKQIGIERTYAARMWNRWSEMKDVSGEALMRLSAAYVAMCQRSEAAEARQIAEGERIARETADEIMAATALSRRTERMGPMATVAATPMASSPHAPSARPLP